MKQHILMPVIDLVFPPVCVGCQRVGKLLCEDCRAVIGPPQIQTGLTLHPILAVSALGYFEQALQQAVHALKYEQCTALAAPLGQMMASQIQLAGWPAGVVIPVPLHAKRLQQRGYNQAALLAQAAAQALGWEFRQDLVMRVRETATQVGLGYHARQLNVQDAFEVISADAASTYPSVILVDDVYTTGATLRACASALRKSGIQAVRASVVAQARPGATAPITSHLATMQ